MYFSTIAFFTVVLLKISSLKKNIFSVTNVCLHFSLRLEGPLNVLAWDRHCNLSSCPIFFFLKSYHKKSSTPFGSCAALRTSLNFSSGSAQTHAFQMVREKASLWLVCSALLAYNRSHYAVTFSKKLRQKAFDQVYLSGNTTMIFKCGTT